MTEDFIEHPPHESNISGKDFSCPLLLSITLNAHLADSSSMLSFVLSWTTSPGACPSSVSVIFLQGVYPPSTFFPLKFLESWLFFHSMKLIITSHGGAFFNLRGNVVLSVLCMQSKNAHSFGASSFFSRASAQYQRLPYIHVHNMDFCQFPYPLSSTTSVRCRLLEKNLVILTKVQMN